jgi:hypothetical protein
VLRAGVERKLAISWASSCVCGARSIVNLNFCHCTHCLTIFKTHVCSLYYHFYIYIATHQHTVYLHWLQTVLECISQCAWKSGFCEPIDTLSGHDWASLEMHLEEVLELIWRQIWSWWLRKHRDVLRDHNWASFKMHFEGIIVQTCNPYSSLFRSQIDGLDRGKLNNYLEVVDGQWPVHRLFSPVVNSQQWEYDKLTLSSNSHDKLHGDFRWYWVLHRMLTFYSGVYLQSLLTGRKTTTVRCCTWCILYLVYAALGVSFI